MLQRKEAGIGARAKPGKSSDCADIPNYPEK
jgi:hypothetical protein